MPRPDPDGGLLPIPFTPGIREDVRHLAPVGSLGRAENVRFAADRVYQRPGTNAVSPATAGSVHEIYNNTQPLGLVTRVGECNLLGVDGELFAQDDVSSTFQFAGIYSTCRPLQQRNPFPAGAGREFGATRSGVAVNSDGYVLAFAVSTTTVHYVIESPAGVRMYYGGTTGTKANVLAQGATFLLLIQSGTTISLYQFAIASGAVTVTSSGTMGTLTGATDYWDASAYSASRWLFAYRSGAATMTLLLMSSASAVASTGQAITGNAPMSIWGDFANGRAWVGWYNDPTVTGNVNYRGWTVSGSSWVAYTAATTLFSAVNVYGPPLFGTPASGTGPMWIVQRSDNGTSPYVRGIRWGWLDTSGAAEATSYTGYHVTPISKPDSRGRVWCVTGNESSNWRSTRVVLLRFRHPTPSTVQYQPTIELALDDGLAPYSTSHLPSRQYDYFHAVAEPSTFHAFVAPKVLQQGPGANELISVDYVKYSPAEQQPHRRCDEFGLWTTVAGQPVTAFGFAAGQRDIGAPAITTEHEPLGAIEIGFAYRPAVLVATQGAGGNLTALGVYSWCFVYEWTDPLGQRHRSAPSVPYSLTLTGGNQQVTFSIASLDWHQKITSRGDFDPTLVAYRTVNGGSTWYRETLPSPTGSASARGPGTVTYVSGSSSDQTDANISASEILYTDGGVLGNAMAPACSFSCRTEERLVCGGLLDPRMLHVSKIIVPGEPIQFADSDTFRILLPEACTGLAYQDGLIIAFGRNAVYAISGDGPNDQGVGGFSQARAISRDCGCIDYRSVVESAAGVFFQAARGLHLLPRGGGVPVFVGATIETTTGAYQYCLGALSFSSADVRTVRFLLSTTQYLGSGGTQRVLVYDVELSAQLGYPVWSQDSYGRTLQVCGVWAYPVFGLASLSTANICAYLETGGTADELNTTPDVYSSLIETNPVRAWGVAGWGMIDTVISLQSATSGSPNCTISLYPDGSFLESASWTPATNTEESYIEMRPSKRQCSAFRVRLVAQSSTGSGYVSFHALQVAHQPTGERLTPNTERVV